MKFCNFSSYGMTNGYLRYKDDPHNRTYRIINGKVKCGGIEYTNPDVFCRNIYQAKREEFYTNMLYSDESKFSWMTPKEIEKLGLDKMDLLIRSYRFENGSHVIFKNQYTNKYSKRMIKYDYIDNCKTFYCIFNLVKGDFMENVFVKTRNKYMSLRNWKNEIMRQNNECESE